MDVTKQCKTAYLTLYNHTSESIENYEDLLEVLQLASRDPTQRQLRKIWKDREYMTYEEFCAVVKSIPPTSETEVLNAFKRIDQNGDGYISSQELKHILTTKGEKMKLEEAQRIIDEFDENRDGKLDYIEFSQMFANTQKNLHRKSVDSNMGSKSATSLKEKLSTPTRRGSTKHSDHDIPSAKPRNARRSTNFMNDSEDGGAITKSTRNLKSSQPHHLQDWYHMKSKGGFYFEEDNSVVSHYYSLQLQYDSDVYITVKPLLKSNSSKSQVDVLIFILTPDKSLVSFTQSRDNKGLFYFRGDLKKGRYTLVSFTTGCRFTVRDTTSATAAVKKSAALTRKSTSDVITLTTDFKEALNSIFDLCDLDADNLLNRDEFTWFTQRTCGENVGEDEWNIVRENVDMKDKTGITRKGFIQLNQMEAEESNDSDDLWMTLNFMGFNKQLKMDECCPFDLNVYTQEEHSILKVVGWNETEDLLKRGLHDLVRSKGEMKSISKDIRSYTYSNDFIGFVMVENLSSHDTIKVGVDLNQSKNVSSNRSRMYHNATVSPKSSQIVYHLMPVSDDSRWTVKALVSVLSK